MVKDHESGERQLSLEAYGVISEPLIENSLNYEGFDSTEAGFSFEKLKKSPKHISILIKRANSDERKNQGDSLIDWEMLDEYRLPPGMVENIGKNKYRDEINRHWKQF